MADAGGVIGQFKDEIVETTKNVASEISDQVEQAAEQGIQSITGIQSNSQITPQQVQQKEQADQNQLAETRRVIKWHTDIAEAQKKVRQEQKQKKAQGLQEDQTQKEEKKIKFFKQKEDKKILAPTPVSNIENKNKMAA